MLSNLIDNENARIRFPRPVAIKELRSIFQYLVKECSNDNEAFSVEEFALKKGAILPGGLGYAGIRGGLKGLEFECYRDPGHDASQFDGIKFTRPQYPNSEWLVEEARGSVVKYFSIHHA